MAKKILVIEDDRDIRDAIQYALEEGGYDVTTSEDSKVLRSFKEIAPDMVLLGEKESYEPRCRVCYNSKG